MKKDGFTSNPLFHMLLLQVVIAASFGPTNAWARGTSCCRQGPGQASLITGLGP